MNARDLLVMIFRTLMMFSENNTFKRQDTFKFELLSIQ